MNTRESFYCRMRRRTVLISTLVGVLSSLGGVAYADGQGDSQALAAETDAALNQAGKDANAALESLMAARGAIAPSSSYSSASRVSLVNVPDELKQPITMSWNGGAESLASQIAKAVGYRFVASGPKPATPTIVTMVFHDEPAIWALQRLGIRIRDVATVSVNPNTHEIDYTYKLMSSGAGTGVAGTSN